MIEGHDTNSFEVQLMLYGSWKIKSPTEDLSWHRHLPAMLSLSVMSSMLITAILALFQSRKNILIEGLTVNLLRAQDSSAGHCQTPGGKEVP